MISYLLCDFTSGLDKGLKSWPGLMLCMNFTITIITLFVVKRGRKIYDQGFYTKAIDKTRLRHY